MKKPDLKEQLHIISKYLPYNLEFSLISDKREEFSEELYYDDESKWIVGAIWELIGINYTTDLSIPLGEGCLDGMLLRNGNTYCNFQYDILPILRPMSDLTNDIFDFLYNLESDYPSIADWIELNVESRLSCKFSHEFWEMLYRHKFDIYGLIEQGLAIDINTIEDASQSTP